MRIRVIAGALALALTVAARADAQFSSVFSPGSLTGPLTVHMFEDGVPGGPGATYSSTGGVPSIASACAAADCATPSGSFGLLSQYMHRLRIDFALPTSSMGLWFGNDDTCCSGPFSAYMYAYNGASLVGTVSMAANMNDSADQFMGFNSTTEVTRVELEYGAGDVSLYLYVDDVQFNVADAAVVPEPASVALLATGLLGIGGVALRRRRRSS